MLSRVAESLFWMGRYVERTGHTARVLEVLNHLALDFGAEFGELIPAHWESALDIFQSREEFTSSHPSKLQADVIAWMTLDKSQHNSILSCLRKSRECARSIREQISSEMWEELNRLYLMVNDAAPREAINDGDQFFRKVRNGLMLFGGITASTLPRDEGWLYYQYGVHVERSLQIIAITHGRLKVMEKESADRNDIVLNTLEWRSLLRSLGCYEAYRTQMGVTIRPELVLEYVLLGRDFPLTLSFSLARSRDFLNNICDATASVPHTEPRRMMGKLAAEFEYLSPRELKAENIPRLLEKTYGRLTDATSLFQQHFF